MIRNLYQPGPILLMLHRRWKGKHRYVDGQITQEGGDKPGVSMPLTSRKVTGVCSEFFWQQVAHKKKARLESSLPWPVPTSCL